MDFELNEDQRGLRDSLARLMAQRYSFEQRRVHAATEAGHDDVTWSKLAELGVTALPVPEAYGGFGGGARDLLPVMEQLGAALSLEPVLASVVLGTTAVRLAADDMTCQKWLPDVAAGTSRLAWAHDEEQGRHSPWWIETTATSKGSEWFLTGRKVNVLGAAFADRWVVSARLSGAPGEATGCALFLVDATAAGVHARNFRLVDDTCASELSLNQAVAVPLGDPLDCARAKAAIEGTLGLGIAAVCADMVGAMDAAFRLATDYLKTRKQFGRLIGENQALRHRAAEMLVSLELARSMAITAAVAVDGPLSDDAKRDLHRAKLSVARHARIVAHGAIQLHGGIGMTEEYAVGHYLRRIHVMDQLFGDGEAHAAQLADLISA